MKKASLFTLSILGTLLSYQHSANASVISAGTASNPCTSSNYFELDDNGNPICKNGVSGAVTSIENLRLSIPSTRKQASSEEDETASLSSQNGMSAGDIAANSGFWGSAIYSEFESTFIAAAYEADTTNVLLGYDVMIGPRSVLGVAVGHEDLSTTTFYNGGGDDQNGFVIAPYYGVALSDRLTFDMSVGITSLDHDQHRIDPANGATLSASYDAIRYFGALNLSHSYKFDRNILSARLGYTIAQETQDGYTETGGPSARTVQERTVELSQAEIGVDAIHFGNGFSPYASVTFRKDLDMDDDAAAGGLPGGNIVRSDDKTETEVVLGIDFTPQQDLTVSLEGNKVFSRDQYDKWGIGLSFRMPL